MKWSTVSGHHHHNVAGALGVLGLAVAVGGLVISSLGGSGRGSSPEAPGIPLLDRVPEPLPVGKKVKEASQQVTGKRKPCATAVLGVLHRDVWDVHTSL